MFKYSLSSVMSVFNSFNREDNIRLGVVGGLCICVCVSVCVFLCVFARMSLPLNGAKCIVRQHRLNLAFSNPRNKRLLRHTLSLRHTHSLLRLHILQKTHSHSSSYTHAHTHTHTHTHTTPY